MTRSVVLGVLAAFVLSACSGTQTGRTLFGTPSNNVISAITLSFPTPPNRSAGAQALALQVDAFDRWGNRITVGYNNSITLSSNGSACEVAFSFYQTANSGTTAAQPVFASLTYNSPQEIGVLFNPQCGPNPVVITASTPGIASVTVSL